MGGHGGLNILPQKRWNVYNYDNRERVRRDEQEAARQQHEQRERQQSQERDARLTELRRRRNGVVDKDGAEGQAHGPVAEVTEPEETKVEAVEPADGSTSSINQHNIEALFDNTPMKPTAGNRRGLQAREQPKAGKKKKTLKEREEQPGDDDRYRLGYSREGSKQPWYMVASTPSSPPRVDEKVLKRRRQADEAEPRKRSIEELRAERLEREEKERRRAQGLVAGPSVKRRYNSSYL